MKIKLDHIEKITGYKVKKYFKSIGLDIAERTGVCNIKTTDQYATIQFNFLEFDSTDINRVYKDMHSSFRVIICNQDIVVIEDSFYGMGNPDVFKKLTRFGSLALAVTLEKDIKRQFILATTSRSKLGIKTTKKAGYGAGQSKKAVADWLRKYFAIDLKGDDDASDAVVLAILGLLDDFDFRSKAQIKKEKDAELKAKDKNEE